MKFSKRLGKAPVATVFQTNSIDPTLRNRLWNVLYQYVLEPNISRGSLSSSRLHDLFLSLWDKVFSAPVDSIPFGAWDAVKDLRKRYFNVNWFEVYDILEHVLALPLPTPGLSYATLTRAFNQVLEQEMAGYRVLDRSFTPITSDVETQAIVNAIEATANHDLKGPNAHLRSALAKLSDRIEPDYRNSIKESISAVESIAKLVAGNERANLGDALKVIDEKIELHKALKTAFSNLYGYTSDEKGIRHALLDTPNVDFEDAKFMLITCSAFVSFLLGKCAKGGIPL